jgi:simple sugar transport system ATP-binding protein
MINIHKVYPDGTRALEGVTLDVYRGEVLALLGENGAGKTTLMRILYGEISPTRGKILVDGREVRFRGTWDAIRFGIRMIYQSFSLIRTFTVVENVYLFLKAVDKHISISDVKKRIETLCTELGFSLPLDEVVENLPAAKQQQVEIVKALASGGRLLILDEPTAMLTPIEARELFKLIRKIKERGVSMVLITHKLREVFEVADRVVVLRRGRKVGEYPVESVNEAELARLMIGEEVKPLQLVRVGQRTREAILRVEGLWARGEKEQDSLKDLNLYLLKGEIYGLAGIQGNGQRTLAEVLMGLRMPVRGRILFEGTDITYFSVAERLKMGLRFIPELSAEALIEDMSISENVFITNHASLSKWGIIDVKKLNRVAEGVVKSFSIVTPSIKAAVRSLSGGNKRRVVVGRELVARPKLLIAMEPTSGLDVKSTAFVHRLLLEYRNSGGSVLLISSDLNEILSLSDRVGVMYGGRIVGEGRPEDWTVERLGLCMGGSC